MVALAILLPADSILGIVCFLGVVCMVLRSFTVFEVTLLLKLVMLAIALFGIWDLFGTLEVAVETPSNDEEEPADDDDTSTDTTSEFSDLVEPHTKKIVTAE